MLALVLFVICLRVMQNIESANSNQIKIGRFAPSPTGALHFGSLIAAVSSYLCARQHPESQWLLRIEDVDTQRKQKGAATAIIKTLEDYGFEWNGEITYQSERTKYYQEALETLTDSVYPCSCTRKELQTLSSDMTYGYNYPGLCRNGILNTKIKKPSIRVTTKDVEICFQDECQTELFCQKLETDIGDFILKRRDGLFAYQLAVVVDDHLQGINHIVRGADLFDNTPRQIYLQQLLGYKTPSYLHFPVATTTDGKKLSKQNHSPEIALGNSNEMIPLLLKALLFLGQNPPNSSEFSTLDDLWNWSKVNWNMSNIPKALKIIYQD